MQAEVVMKRELYLMMLATTLIVLFGASTPLPVQAQQAYLTHPSSCVAPFLYQAEGMRWHEQFLLNPSDGVPTWAVCPINMYFREFIIPEGMWSVQVYLQHTLDASPTEPACYFTVHSVINQKWGDFINGTRHAYTVALQNSTTPSGITIAQRLVTPENIVTALGPGADQYPFHAAVFCALDPGWGLNGGEVIEATSP
jgi:hypothetical protein